MIMFPVNLLFLQKSLYDNKGKFIWLQIAPNLSCLQVLSHLFSHIEKK